MSFEAAPYWPGRFSFASPPLNLRRRPEGRRREELRCSGLYQPDASATLRSGSQQAGSAGMSSGPSSGASKNVATKTVTSSVALKAVWTWP